MNEEYEGFDWGKIAVVVSILIILTLIFLISPQVQGVSDNIQELRTNDLGEIRQDYNSLAVNVNNLSDTCYRSQINSQDINSKYTACASEKSSISTDLVGTKSSLQTCTTDKTNLQTTIQNCQNNINSITNLSLINQAGLNMSMTSLLSNLTTLNNNYQSLANNTARLLCCVYVNQTSANYSIQSNSISCSGTGNASVSCV